MIHVPWIYGSWTIRKLLETPRKALPPAHKRRKYDFTKTPHTIRFGKAGFRPHAFCRPPICPEDIIPHGKERCVVPAEMTRLNTMVYPIILRTSQYSSQRPKADPDVCVKKTTPLTYQRRCDG